MTDRENDSRSGPTPDDTLRTDVVIVGAGPGGASLAYLLARSGVETVLIERHTDFSREFRGFSYQPQVLKLFDQMGLLEDVRSLGGREVKHATLDAFGNTYEIADYTTFDPPYDYTLFLEQPPLLATIVEHAGAYDTFRYQDGTTVNGLVEEDGRIVGVRAKDRESNVELEVRGRAVVGADGRFSAVRKLADIEPGRLASDIELVWFKLPSSVVETPHETFLNEAGLLAYFGLDGDEVQAGWPIPKGDYPALRNRGIEAFREQLVAVDPGLEAAFPEALPDFDATTLLNIAPGIADEWVRDGLALIGDAAHVASPFGGQGIPMAIQDAAALHPTLVEAIHDDPGGGIVSRDRLRAYETRRRPSVETVMATQRREERALSWLTLNKDRIPTPVLRSAIWIMFGLGGPLVRRFQRSFALNVDPDPVSVATEHFRDTPRRKRQSTP